MYKLEVTVAKMERLLVAGDAPDYIGASDVSLV
jgi:hypothetical protein